VVQETYEYHYDGAHAAVEYRPGKTWTVVYGAGIDEVVMRTDGTDKEFYYRDGLNSITAVADASGNLLEAYEYNVQGQIAIYDDQGNSLNVSGIGNDITYTGRRLDQQTGNYYYRARYYNPVLGRFISRDPLSAAEFKEGSNLYAYVGNNGANFIDPYGLQGSRKGWSKPGNTSLSPRAKAAWKGAAGVGVGALAAVGGVMGRNGAVAAAGVLTAAQGLAGLANAAFNPDAKPSDVPFVPLDLPTVVFIEPTPPPSPEPPTPPSPEPLVPEPEPETK
jgi:RHS repeat-associated protein